MSPASMASIAIAPRVLASSVSTSAPSFADPAVGEPAGSAEASEYLEAKRCSITWASLLEAFVASRSSASRFSSSSSREPTPRTKRLCSSPSAERDLDRFRFSPRQEELFLARQPPAPVFGRASRSSELPCDRERGRRRENDRDLDLRRRFREAERDRDLLRLREPDLEHRGFSFSLSANSVRFFSSSAPLFFLRQLAAPPAPPRLAAGAS
mmetsp:Transcript_10766/g.27711  ORF Transcript_10766/g.27711 Transcript_10766/m.27711 type:complete len:211 (-) Transcript_10766:362-994(-)